MCTRVHTKDLFMKKILFKYGIWKKMMGGDGTCDRRKKTNKMFSGVNPIKEI